MKMFGLVTLAYELKIKNMWEGIQTRKKKLHYRHNVVQTLVLGNVLGEPNGTVSKSFPVALKSLSLKTVI